MSTTQRNSDWSEEFDDGQPAGDPWVKHVTVNDRPERVIDWPAYFEAGKIDLAATRGMDADEIRETLPPPLVHGCLRHGSVGLLGGASKARKSWLALFLALCVVNGRSWLGFRVEKSRVRYLDFELKARTAAGRYALARLGVTDDPDEQAEIDAGITFHAMRSMPSENGTLAGVAQWIEAAGQPGELWILDCLQPVLEVDANDSVKVRAEFRPLLRATEKSGIVLLIVDHFNKNGEARGMARISGSVAKVAAVDSIVTLTPQDGGIIAVDFDLREDPPVEGETLIRFNSHTHGFDLISSADAQAERDRRELETFMEWIGTGWPDGNTPRTRNELCSAWNLKATSGVTNRIEKLKSAGFVMDGEPRGAAKTYQLSPT
jgi:hypothetical protein